MPTISLLLTTSLAILNRKSYHSIEECGGQQVALPKGHLLPATFFLDGRKESTCLARHALFFYFLIEPWLKPWIQSRLLNLSSRSNQRKFCLQKQKLPLQPVTLQGHPLAISVGTNYNWNFFCCQIDLWNPQNPDTLLACYTTATKESFILQQKSLVSQSLQGSP